MRLAVTLLGLDVLTIELSAGDDDNGTNPGDCTSTQVGFVPTESLPIREPGWDVT